jgi:hypothetical protein
MGASHQLADGSEHQVLREFLGIGSLILPSGIYIALFGASLADAAGADVFASELATTLASRHQREREFFSATGPTDVGFAENATDCLFATAGGARPTLLAIGLTNSATQRQGTLIWWGGLQTVQTVLVNRRAKVSRATWTSPSTRPITVAVGASSGTATWFPHPQQVQRAATATTTTARTARTTLPTRAAQAQPTTRNPLTPLQ